jgi:hypothetical protein
VITGFNTDIEHEGVVYHVQTEDKGLDTPFILSLVYVGGAILASKRSPYTDLLGGEFDSAALGERLQRQHTLICAAITSGRIEQLKRLNERENEAMSAGGHRPRRGADKSASAPPPAPSVAPPATPVPPPAASVAPPAPPLPQPTASQPPAPSTLPPPPPAVVVANESQPVVESRAGRNKVREEVPPPPRPQVEATPEPAEPIYVEAEAGPGDAEWDAAHGAAPPFADARPEAAPQFDRELIPVEIDGELYVNLMEERDYRAGEIVTLRVRVSRGPIESREAVNDANVTVKVLGTEFRPLILTSKTDQDGVAVVHAWLPRFTNGRAAILVRASADGYAAELRRAVRHS